MSATSNAAMAVAPETLSAQPRRAALIVAIGAALVVVLLAPLMGEVRRYVRDAFPGHFVAAVGAGVALAAAVAVGWALSRIRERRGRRYALVAAAIALAVGSSRWAALGIPDSDAVEHVHFIEYGFVTWLFYRAWRPMGGVPGLWLTACCALTVGTFEEWFQWFVPARVGELRDVFLNLAAIACGLMFSVAVQPPVRPRASWRRGLSWACLVTSVAVGALAGFIDSAHLGYEIHDPAIGTFRSIYDADELRSAANDRERRWSTHPPPLRPPRYSREDQYASEALLHVQERNRQWVSGDIASAWGENRILEAYFAPVLDSAPDASVASHRWPAAQRADAERRAAMAGRTTFVSRALGSFPFFLWPHATFRLLSAAVVGLLLVAAALTRHPARTL